MRPLDKGTFPIDTATGLAKVVSKYQDWRKDLIDRIGYYCVYCNMPLSHNLQVEHVTAKNPKPGQAAGSLLDWSNMLLACGSCNNAKDNKPISNCYMPETHNTLLPFEIVVHSTEPGAAIVRPKGTLSPVQIQKANDTISLTELDNTDRRDKIADIRWMKRRAAMLSVETNYNLFCMAKSSQTYDANEAATAIALQAKENGFFGLWFEKFANEPTVLEKLIDQNIIKGTARNCFDATTFQPIPRNPSNNSDSI